MIVIIIGNGEKIKSIFRSLPIEADPYFEDGKYETEYDKGKIKLEFIVSKAFYVDSTRADHICVKPIPRDKLDILLF